MKLSLLAVQIKNLKRSGNFTHTLYAYPLRGRRGTSANDKITQSQAGELTDIGRRTTFELGQRLRHLYVEQLGFLPAFRSNADDLYLRSSPIPRALQSLHEVFWGLYPATSRSENFRRPTIVERSMSDETLFPNEAGCRRLRQLTRIFSEIAAKNCKWFFH